MVPCDNVATDPGVVEGLLSEDLSATFRQNSQRLLIALRFVGNCDDILSQLTALNQHKLVCLSVELMLEVGTSVASQRVDVDHEVFCDCDDGNLAVSTFVGLHKDFKDLLALEVVRPSHSRIVALDREKFARLSQQNQSLAEAKRILFK